MYRWPGPTLRRSDLVSLVWSRRICMSNKFPGDADNVISGMTL